MRVTILASGSGGNATLVQAGGARVLVDAGIGPRVIERRMRRVFGRALGVDAIVTTHPHGDHVGRVEPCARHFDAPVFLTAATQRRLRLGHVPTRVFGRDAPFAIGPLVIEPMPVPHDAPQVALVFAHRGARAALVTDLGHVPRGLAGHLADCQLVLLESNHDPAMLEAGPYPAFLKRRIASRLGHLSNQQAAHLLSRLGPGVRQVVLMHLSERCNAPMLAVGSARAALRGRRVKVRVAHQDEPLDLTVRPGPRVRRPAHEAQLALPL
ncbi:MAG TPA: MBL fold metallo-hydrolase [Sandaracinaceae bacterium LLY-WYZ-13_1]|nr:MBL fold metallo-hydrolase [Sandaracinaceae bacterium LLY-WYZ-13_1]